MAKKLYVGSGAARKGKKLYVGVQKTAYSLELVKSQYEERFAADQIFDYWTLSPMSSTTGKPITPDGDVEANTIVSSPNTWSNRWLKGASNTYYQFHSVAQANFTSASHIFRVSEYQLVITRAEVARKVKRGYVGDESGIARLFFAGGGLEYYGRATDLSAARTEGAAASNDNYAIYAGGTSAEVSAAVDAYDKTLTRTVAASLPLARYGLAAATVNNTVIFAGGRKSNGDAVSAVNGYDGNLSLVTCTGLTRQRWDLAGASNGEYALFAGGVEEEDEMFRLIDGYDTSITKVSVTGLNTYKWGVTGVSTPELAVFVGGSTNMGESYGDTLIEAYDTSLTQITGDHGRVFLRGAGVAHGDYILLAGGRTGAWSGNAGRKTTVSVFDKSLTSLGAYELYDARDELAGAAIEGYALFAGGENLTDDGVVPRWSNVVNVFDESMTRTLGAQLERYHTQLVGASVGDFALFMGGKAMDTTTLENSATDYSAAVYAWNI